MNSPSPFTRQTRIIRVYRRRLTHATWIVALLVLIAPGCSTHFDRLQPIRTAFFDGNLAVAQESLDKEIKKRKGEAERPDA